LALAGLALGSCGLSAKACGQSVENYPDKGEDFNTYQQKKHACHLSTNTPQIIQVKRV